MLKCRARSGATSADIPAEVSAASDMDWGVAIDAYLVGAARVGKRYAASAYLDRSGLIANGATVATPEVSVVGQRGGFLLLRSLSGQDHYVIAGQYSPGHQP